jgi:hypothetical protein
VRRPDFAIARSRRDKHVIPSRSIRSSDGGPETFASKARPALACGYFLHDALAGRVSHCDQQILNGAVASVTKRFMPGSGFAWDRATARPDRRHR